MNILLSKKKCYTFRKIIIIIMISINYIIVINKLKWTIIVRMNIRIIQTFYNKNYIYM